MKKIFSKRIFDIFKESHEDNEKHRDNIERIVDFCGGHLTYVLAVGVSFGVVSTVVTFAVYGFDLELCNWNLIRQIGLGGLLFPSIIYIYPVATYGFHLIKNLIKHKIKQLEAILSKILSNTKEVKSNKKNKMLRKKVKYNNKLLQQKIKAYPYIFKDTIYGKASDLLDKIEFLNNDTEKKRLKTSIRGILQEYRDGIKLEQNIGPVELSVSKCKSIKELQFRIRNGLVTRLWGQLNSIDISINVMLEKQITESEWEKERLLLEERLGPIVIDSEEIDDVLRQREENIAPAPVRHRGKTGKVKSRALYTKY